MGRGKGMDHNMTYVREKRIALLLNEMVVHLLGQRPVDAVESLIEYLEIKQQQQIARAAEQLASGPPAAAAAASPAAAAPQSATSQAAASSPAAVSPKSPSSPKAYQPQEREKQPVKPAEWSEPKEPKERHSHQCAKDKFPVGCEVELHGVSEELDGKRARVVGHCRGRVGVQMYEFTPPMGIVPGQLRRVKSAAQDFPVGTEVQVLEAGGENEGRSGRVVGHFRGRVGVELEDGAKIGVPPDVLRRVGPSMAQKFPIGAEVELVDVHEDHDGKRGRVIGHRGQRVGIELEDGKTVEGHPGSTLKLVGRSHTQMFKVGTEVEVVCEDGGATQEFFGQCGRVTGHHRGRVGVEMADGSKLGLPPAHLRPVGKTAVQEFPVGCEVTVVSESGTSGRTGRVTGHSRGRVGVELDDGSTLGVVPSQLRAVGRSASQSFRVGDEVSVQGAAEGLNGRTGRVKGISRGRIGVELSDGTAVGLPPTQLKLVTGQKEFKLGAEVEVIAAVTVDGLDLYGRGGRVCGISRGRVGVELSGSNTKVGLPAYQLRLASASAEQKFRKGDEVEIAAGNPKHGGHRGRVTGRARGRIGVELDNGEVIGVPPDQLKAVERMAEQHVKKGMAVVIVCDDEELSGKRGTVTGTHRNRVGIEIDNGNGTGRVIGVPASCVRPDVKAAEQLFKKGDEVEIVDGDLELQGKFGRVTACARNRVGVELRAGGLVGLPASTLRKVPAFASQKFKVGDRVMFKCEDESLNGKAGVVTGSNRNRVGVEIDNGSGTGQTVGVPSSCVVAEPKGAHQLFQKGAEVEIVGGALELQGKFGRVTGRSRGRVGVELRDGTAVGVPPDTLKVVPKMAEQTAKKGSRVELVCQDEELSGLIGTVTGSSRNRVGVEIVEKGVARVVGVPSSCVKPEGKSAEQAFKVGNEVEIVGGSVELQGKFGRVCGKSRGRVGVELRSGEKIGVPADQLRAAPLFAAQTVKVGDAVCIVSEDDDLSGRVGTVTGTNRNRVGVEIADGAGGHKVVGVPTSCVRVEGRSAAQQFAKGDEVEIVAGEQELAGLCGRVTGRSRGRVGVLLSDQRTVGVPAENLRRVFPMAEQQFKKGTEVSVVHESDEYNGKTGFVEGRYRNRVGVMLNDGLGKEHLVGLPAGCLRPMGNSAEQLFRKGEEVEVVGGSPEHVGKTGRCGGRSRGRVGVVLGNGDSIGVLPEHLRQVQAFAEQRFKKGTEVVFVHEDEDLNGKSGFVTGTHRNRVGVQVDDGRGGGKVVGVPISCLRAVGRSADQAFKIGDEVQVVGAEGDAAALVGRVSGKSRGRIGVELRNGGQIGVLPQNLRPIGREAAQAFQVGQEVVVLAEDQDIAGKTGTVTGRHRGRVGVCLSDGTTIGVPGSQLSLVGKSTDQKFSTGAEVEVVSGEHAGSTGRVTGRSRGRIGVTLLNGAVIGVPGDTLRAVGRTAGQTFRVGTAVEIIGEDKELSGLTGSVTGASRGRVGVALHSGGKTVGVPAETLRVLTDAGESFGRGCRVAVRRDERAESGCLGTVTGHARGRVAVQLDDGELLGLPPDQLTKLPPDTKSTFPEGSKVQIVSPGSDLDGELAQVVGHSRGRVGVELADGARHGLTPAHLRPAEKTTADFAIGTVVEVYPGGEHDGDVGTVKGHHRGRVGVELEDSGKIIGVPAQSVRLPAKSRVEQFTVGTDVEYKQHPGDAPKVGKVTGVSRGRVGIEVDGQKIGCHPEMLRKM